MFLDSYRKLEDQKITFTRQQASDFAKNVAGDFNPIHDVDAKRFCVPGDLLFACAIENFGISESMCFVFSGMVTDGVSLDFSKTDSATIDIKDDNDKKYLGVERKGNNIATADVLRNLTCAYVEFSGQTFPHILVPLMEKHNVMINPARPLVIYERMSIELNTLDFETISLETSETVLKANGKRGEAFLNFNIKSNDEVVGTGKKKMLLSGLRPYNSEEMQAVIDNYEAVKSNYIKA